MISSREHIRIEIICKENLDGSVQSLPLLLSGGEAGGCLLLAEEWRRCGCARVAQGF